MKLQQAPYAQTNNNSEISLLINSLIARVTITADPGRETLLWLLNASTSAVRFFTPSAQTSQYWYALFDPLYSYFCRLDDDIRYLLVFLKLAQW